MTTTATPTARRAGTRLNRPHRTTTTASPSTPRGAEVLDRLRGPVGRRPQVDPGLAGGLRAWLEDGVAVAAATVAHPSNALFLTARDLRFEGELPPSVEPARMTVEMARGAVVHALFRQLLTVGRVGQPLDDALDAFDVDPRQSDVATFIRNLSQDDRATLAHEVADHTAQLRRHFPALAPGWFPRTNDRIVVPLAGGRVILADTFDLVVGAPSVGSATVCVVDVASGSPNSHHRTKRHFQALVETLRSGAPPFRVATYFSATGEMEVDDVSDSQLAATVQLVIDVAGTGGGCQP